jgi:hypothetical protein
MYEYGGVFLKRGIQESLHSDLVELIGNEWHRYHRIYNSLVTPKLRSAKHECPRDDQLQLCANTSTFTTAAVPPSPS